MSTVLPMRHLGAEAERQLVEPRPLHERAVGRAEVAQHHPVRSPARRPRWRREMVGSESGTSQPAARAERERDRADRDRLAAVGTFHDQQPPAAGLADDRCAGVEDAGRRSSRSFVRGRSGRRGTGVAARRPRSPLERRHVAARRELRQLGASDRRPEQHNQDEQPGRPAATRATTGAGLGAEVDRLGRRQVVAAAVRVEPAVRAVARRWGRRPAGA